MKSFQSVFETSWLQGRKLVPIMERHGALTRGSVLDLGCGASPLRPLFPNAETYIRMDRLAIDPDVIVIDDPLNLPLDDASIEVILLSRMLGDIPDQVGLMRELARVMRPDGRILIYEAISYPQHDLPHDYWRVLPAGLGWAASRAGLQLQETEYLGGYFTQIALQLNVFAFGGLARFWALRPLAAGLRAVTNLSCAGLDAIAPRPELATDYFACVVKQSEHGGPST
ncbi:MAG: methyltransferase domain-containing protein [Pseudomonadota bacterium]